MRPLDANLSGNRCIVVDGDKQCVTKHVYSKVVTLNVTKDRLAASHTPL